MNDDFEFVEKTSDGDANSNNANDMETDSATDSTTETENAAETTLGREPAIDLGNSTFHTLKISKLENDLQMKCLELAGKNDEIAVQKIQIMEITDEKDRLKEEIELKNSVNESLFMRIGGLENDLEQKGNNSKSLKSLLIH